MPPHQPHDHAPPAGDAWGLPLEGNVVPVLLGGPPHHTGIVGQNGRGNPRGRDRWGGEEETELLSLLIGVILTSFKLKIKDKNKK